MVESLSPVDILTLSSSLYYYLYYPYINSIIFFLSIIRILTLISLSLYYPYINSIISFSLLSLFLYIISFSLLSLFLSIISLSLALLILCACRDTGWQAPVMILTDCSQLNNSASFPTVCQKVFFNPLFHEFYFTSIFGT